MEYFTISVNYRPLDGDSGAHPGQQQHMLVLTLEPRESGLQSSPPPLTSVPPTAETPGEGAEHPPLASEHPGSRRRGRPLAWTSQDTGPVGMGDLINLMLLSAGIISDEALLEAVLRHSAEQFRGAPPASKAAIEGLALLPLEGTTCTEMGAEGSGPGMLCVICQGVMAAGTLCVHMPCMHPFHPPCLHPWLALHNTCPTCRLPIDPEVPPPAPDPPLHTDTASLLPSADLLHRLLGDIRSLDPMLDQAGPSFYPRFLSGAGRPVPARDRTGGVGVSGSASPRYRSLNLPAHTQTLRGPRRTRPEFHRVYEHLVQSRVDMEDMQDPWHQHGEDVSPDVLHVHHGPDVDPVLDMDPSLDLELFNSYGLGFHARQAQDMLTRMERTRLRLTEEESGTGMEYRPASLPSTRMFTVHSPARPRPRDLLARAEPSTLQHPGTEQALPVVPFRSPVDIPTLHATLPPARVDRRGSPMETEGSESESSSEATPSPVPGLSMEAIPPPSHPHTLASRAYMVASPTPPPPWHVPAPVYRRRSGLWARMTQVWSSTTETASRLLAGASGRGYEAPATPTVESVEATN